MTTEIKINNYVAVFDTELLRHLPEIKREINISHVDNEYIESAVRRYKYFLCDAYLKDPYIYYQKDYCFNKILPILILIADELNDFILIEGVVNDLGYYLIDYHIDVECINFVKRLIDNTYFFESVLAEELHHYMIVKLLQYPELKEYIIDKLNKHPKGLYHCYRAAKLQTNNKMFDDSESKIKWRSDIKNYLLKDGASS